MKKIILTENTNKELVDAKIEEPKATVKENVTNKKKYNASFDHLKGDMVSFKTEANEIKLKYLSSKNIDINPQFTENNKVVVYEDVEDGIDLKYELEDRRLKESFIIKNRKNNYVFNFETKIGNLEPSYDEVRKCLEFKKDNRVVCRMLPPFMVDNKGEESKKCSYEVENNEEGTLSIKLVADADWINSYERELPIIIDPTFELVPPISIGVVEVNQGTGTSSYECESDEVVIGHKMVNGEPIYYQFSIEIGSGTLSQGDWRNSTVYLEMPIKNKKFQNNDSVIITAFSVTKIFNANELFSNSSFRFNLSEFINEDNVNSYVYITMCMISDPLVAKTRGDIYQGKEFDGNDYFATLKTKNDDGSSACKIVYATEDEEVDIPDAPRVRHRPAENSNSYIDYDIGVSGSTSVNIQSKIWKHRINDLSINSGLLTLNIDHIYNSSNNENGAFGQGWTLSPLQKLKKYWNGDYRVIIFTDCNGLECRFIEKWYYKDGDVKKYVNKKDVVLSDDNKLVYLSKDNNAKSYPVHYELINEEGYEYVSLGSGTDYDFKPKQYKYYMNYNGFKKEVIIGEDNYLQFVYCYGSSERLADNDKICLLNNDFVAILFNETIQYRAYFSDQPTRVYFENGEAKVDIYYNELTGSAKYKKTVTLEKVPVYENLDEDLYTNFDIENLEHEMLQAKHSLKEINDIILRNTSKEPSLLTMMKNKNFNDKNIRMEKDKDGNPLEDQYYHELDDYSGDRKLYSAFIQLEQELMSAYNQKLSIERNEYFLTRKLYSKIKEQKESANDYIIEPNGNILMFDGYGRMIGIADKYKNQIDIVFDDNSNIETIKSNDDEIVFKYSDDKKIKWMKKSNGDVVKFNYFMDSLSEIEKNGRKTTFVYMNGFQVYCDNDDEIIIDNQTHNTLKVKKYIHQGTINQDTTFAANPFVARDLATNDMFEYLNQFTTTKITDRIKKESSIIEFDDKPNPIKKIEEKECAYYNYDEKDRLISSVTISTDSNALFPGDNKEFEETTNKYSLLINESRVYSTKNNSFCLKVTLKDIAFSVNSDRLKNITLSVYYYKSGEKYNFKQIFPIKENDTLVLPFFMEGSVSKFEANVESNLSSASEMMNYIKEVGIYEVESGLLQEYDEEDRLWKIKTNEGKTTYLTFEDKLPTHIEFKDWNGKAVTKDYDYNNEKRIARSIDSKGNCENYLYQNEGNKIEKKSFNLKDASLVRNEISEYDETIKAYLEKGDIKNDNGDYPEIKTVFYPGTNIVKSVIELDGSKTEYVVNPRTKNLIGLIKENDGVKNSIAYVYNLDYLTSVKNNGTEVNYTYDGQKRIKTVRVKGYSYNLIENTYEDNKGVLGSDGKSYKKCSSVKTSFNGNSFRTDTTYKENGDLLRCEKSYESEKFVNRYYYNDNDSVTKIETIKTGANSYTETIDYSYDDKNRIVSTIKSIVENEDFIGSVHYSYTYNNDGSIKALDISISENPIQTSSYTYSVDKLLVKEIINSKYQINFEYDALNRIHHREVKNDNNVTICHNYSYLQQDGNTLDLISEDNVKISNSSNEYLVENHKYKYDVNSRITEIDIDEKKIAYEYDCSGRLLKEKNEILGIENRYSYDTLGNILSKNTYDYVNKSLIQSDELVYSCDSKHLLVSVNGKAITYDAYGRMTSYNGKDFVWNKDGSLKSLSLNGEESIEYAYNDKGTRYLKRLSNGETIRFVLDGNKILREESTNGYCIDYLYGSNGLFGFKYNGEEYIYEKNIFGDVVRIYNYDGEIVGEYLYDAFGNVTVVTDINGIASINPFKYRGYYFDNESGLYYLNYRYYDPSLGRFISPDDISYVNPDNVNGLNIYAYCNNDPVNCSDSSGHSPEWWQWLFGAAMIVVGAALCVTGFGTALGAGLIVGGVASTTSNIVSAFGGDSKLCTIISSGCNIIGGIALCAVGLGSVGSTLIGSGVGAIAGGFISEGLGYSFATGALIGGIVGGILGGVAYKIYDTFKIAQISNQGSVVVGEGMNNVSSRATELGAGEFHTSKVSDFFWKFNKTKKFGEWITMNNNRNWIIRACKSSANIIDVGLDMGKNVHSAYYLMERTWMFIYRNVPLPF